MESEDDLPTCGRVRNELAAFVYGELAPDARGTLERHLESCGACRDELAALRDTQRLLARWETPPALEDPRQLARAIAAQAAAEVEPASVTPAPRRGRLVRWSAFACGAAAALLFVLSVLNARASLEGGRLQLDFALPGSHRVDGPTVATTGLPAGLADQVRTIAAQEVAARAANLQQNQEQVAERYSQMTRQELLQEIVRLSQAVDVALDQKERTWNSQLDTLTRETANADLQMRQAITRLASYQPETNH